MSFFEYKYLTWAVQSSAKEPLLRFILEGLEASGCTIVWKSETTHAPFFIVFDTPVGERQGVLVYAFLANSKLTTNRPEDEHRFQVKYGSDSRAVLPIEQDPSHLITTIFVGIDVERGFLVSADPVLHDGTRLFISIEFKRRHADQIQADGWHAWERTSSRRSDAPVEVLVGVQKNRILDLIRFERLAYGLDAGHRQMLAEQFLGYPKMHFSTHEPHSLSKELCLSTDEVMDLIATTGRLKMAVRGWVAEVHLERKLQEVPGVEDCHRCLGEGQPDIQLSYKGSFPITIECKNVLRTKRADGTARVDFQRTRSSKSDPCSRFYQASDFEVLAACLHAVTENWDFRFALTSSLPPHKNCPGRITNNISVDNQWFDTPEAMLNALTSVS